MNDIINTISSAYSFWSAIKGFVDSLVIEVIGITIAFVTAAIIFFIIFHKLGWTKITARGPRWFTALSFLGCFSCALIIGGGAAFQIGSANLFVRVIDAGVHGVVSDVLGKTANTLGISLDQKISAQEAIKFINKMEAMRLGQMGVTRAYSDKVYYLTSEPFISQAKIHLQSQPTGSEISLSQVINAVWANSVTTVKYRSKKTCPK